MPAKSIRRKKIPQKYYLLSSFLLLVFLGLVLTLFMTSELFRSRDVRSQASVYISTPTPLPTCRDTQHTACPDNTCYGTSKDGISGCYPTGTALKFPDGSCKVCNRNNAVCQWGYSGNPDYCLETEGTYCKAASGPCGKNLCYGLNSEGKYVCTRLSASMKGSDGQCYKCVGTNNTCGYESQDEKFCAGMK